MIFQWWYWLLAGLGLVLLELAIPAFYIIWFGLGAILVGLVVLIGPQLDLAVQIGLWVMASVAMALLWFRVFRRSQNKTLAGTSSGEAIGEVGLLVGSVAPFQRGRVRFQRPILGSDEWTCLADTEIAAGERVKVLSVEGSLVKVGKV
ncbi:NfeD family protein [Pseudothauera hydrothermalis]|uniref:NfeD family protein n=1 Tax=Pseudothauera hydrothermalis TaxID=2184083 RepID=UPI001F2A7FEE|nr:NfeD family protein [Pseudothauera hydrothermalis]